MAPVLDRKFELDWRSLDYPVSGQTPQYRPRSYTWSCEKFLDQGREGACVGFAFAHEGIARPQVLDLDARSAIHIYREAQKIDPWPGEDYEGTSVLAGAKIMQRLEHYRSYYWALTAEDVARGVAYFGPGILGTNWYEGMDNVDPKGFIDPSGRIRGGHAILVNSVKIVYKPLSWLHWWNRTWSDVDFDRSYVTIHNSWGPDWGDGGTAKLTLTHLQRLLEENGEVCFPDRKYTWER